jgi:hypothetical protein
MEGEGDRREGDESPEESAKELSEYRVGIREKYPDTDDAEQHSSGADEARGDERAEESKSMAEHEESHDELEQFRKEIKGKYPESEADAASHPQVKVEASEFEDGKDDGQWDSSADSSYVVSHSQNLVTA